MGWDGAGGYTRQHNFSADASSGIKILAARMDAELDDFASAMTIALTRNGQNVPTGNMPMGGFRHINVAAATSVNNYMRVREFVENVPIFMTDAESSADRISVSAQYFTSVSANQAPGDGTRILVRVGSNKSSAVLYLNGHSANVEFQDGNRAAESMVSGGIYEFLYSSVDIAWKITRPDKGRTAAEISAGVTPTNYGYEEAILDINRYGPDGTVVGDTAAFNRAVDVAGQYANGAIVQLGRGTYYLSAIDSLPEGIHFRGVGNGTVLMKSTASTVFTVAANSVRFSNMKFDADIGTDTTYGTSGRMIDYPTASTGSDGKITNVDSANIDTVIGFAKNAGQHHLVLGGYWIPYNVAAGSEGLVYRTGTDSSSGESAMFRKIVGLTTDGEIDQRYSHDSQVQAVDCRRIRTNSDTNLLKVMGGRWGSLNVAVTIDGISTNVSGVSISGSVTLAATMSGNCVFVDNTQSSGTFTNNAGVFCHVDHRELDTTYRFFGKNTITRPSTGEEIQTRRVNGNSGDADTTLSLDSTATIIMYGSAITADRAVNLPASGRPGYTYRIVREAAATGAFNVNVGSGPLKALGSAGTWCEVTWSAPAAAWVLTAAGSL